MKKALLSALCSALVIPGLGQVLNRHLKKGILLLVITLGLFVALLVHLYAIVSFMIQDPLVYPFNPDGFTRAFRDYHPFRLYGIIILFLVVWIYAIVDAFVCGSKLDR